jgi:hypothetical protein
MTKMVVLMNHEVSPEQIADANQTLGIDEVIYCPTWILDIWKDIPADVGSFELLQILKPIKKWLEDNVTNNDALLIQGEPVSTYYIVYWLSKKDVKSFAATSRRVVVEEKLPDGSTRKTSMFKHVKFRKYIT